MQLLSLFTLVIAIFTVAVHASHHLLQHRVPATRTESAYAVQKRQLTREKFLLRSEKLTMTSLFGRVDCSIPEPSTLACPCGADYELCGALCRDTTEDPDYCGICSNSCPPGPVGDRGCCGGVCKDFSGDVDNCGVCSRQCDVMNSEDCCNGACADTSSNPEHCGACGNACSVGETCCDGSCRDLNADMFNCGECGLYCGSISPGMVCNGGHCVLF